MIITKYNKIPHCLKGLLLLGFLITCVKVYPFYTAVLAQETLSKDPSSTAVKSEPERNIKQIFESQNASAQKLQIHPFVNDKNSCIICHDIRKQIATDNDSHVLSVEKSGDNQSKYCMNCHPQHIGDHPVLIEVAFRVPQDLPLSGKREITCATCHDTHFIRYSNRPWSPRSYKTKILDYVKRKDEYKTFFLRRNNSKKELCFACHQGLNHQPGY